MTFILSLAAATINVALAGAGKYGPSHSTSGLLWAFMALTIIHILAVIFIRHQYVPLAFGALQFIFIIIIFGLAFRKSQAFSI